MSRNISEKIKKQIAGKQRYRCNNRPESTLRNLEGFSCPLWENSDDPGIFDESGYDIDHIVEFSLTMDNSNDNLQALCKVCHKEKTRRFLTKKTVSAKVKVKNRTFVRDKLGKFLCTKCNKTFTTNQSLTYHHNNDACKNTMYACKYCDKSYTTTTSMYRHTRTSCNVKKEEETKRIPVKIKSTKEKTITRSSKIDKYICEDCGKTFAAKANLNYHTRRNVCKKGQKFKCSYCPSLFSHRSSMYHHMNHLCDHRNSDNNINIDDDIDNREIMQALLEMREYIDRLKWENDEFRSKSMHGDTKINNG